MLRYNSTAYLYDARYADEQNVKYDFIPQDFPSGFGRLVLDLGCGTGLLLPKIMNRGGEIVGLDISKEMLKRAHLFTDDKASINLILADADHLPFRKCCIDTIFVMTLLQNMPDPRHMLNEIREHMKPKGRLIITNLDEIKDAKAFFNLLHQTGFQPLHFHSISTLKCHLAVCSRKKTSFSEKSTVKVSSGGSS
jgi:ubiquinone/menaquinone biosynthesis C-methylase UbiE